MKKSAFSVIVLILFSIMGFRCSNFPSRYENVDQSKTRPFAVICEPAEASPGDTVHVRLVQFTAVDSPVVDWTLSLDVAENEYARNILESHVVDLDSLMLPGSTVSDFSFILPESTLMYSTVLQRTFAQSSTFGGLGIGTVDSLLHSNIHSKDSLPQEIRSAIDNIACKVRLRVHVMGDIDLVVRKDLLVRYSRAYGNTNVNRNPILNWIGIVRVERPNLSDPDSIKDFPHSIQYLYNALSPADVSDTVEIDTGYSYFLAADSGIIGGDTTLQTYSYFSRRDQVVREDLEEYYYDWFYTNLDYADGMETDSLIMMPGDRSRSITRILPPVDTAMHNFKIYTVVRDSRVNQIMFTTGVAYVDIRGYFRYSEGYAARHGK